MDAKLPPKEMFDLPNVGLRLLFDEKQRQTSAAILLQWCLDPEATEHMQRMDVMNPFIFISVTSPSGLEERHVVPLWDWQKRIIFHRSGTHTIRARVVWYSNEKTLRDVCLKWEERGKYNFSHDFLKENFDGLGNAELELEVEDGFFAKEPSPFNQWWLQLWLGPLTDDCSIRRRYAFAYLVQAPLVVAWMFFLCAWRVVVAAHLNGFCLERNVRWYTVLHPFEYDTKDIWKRDVYDDLRSVWDRTSGALILYKDTDGTDRHWLFYSLWFFFPPVQLVLLFATSVLMAARGEVLSFQTFATMYVAVVILVALVIAAIAAIVFAVYALAVAIGWLFKFFGLLKDKSAAKTPKAPTAPNRFYLWLQKVGSALYWWFLGPTMQSLRESSERRAKEARLRRQEELNRRYMELSCEKAPEQGVRTFSQIVSFNKARIPQLLMDKIKTSKLCRPVARG